MSANSKQIYELENKLRIIKTLDELGFIYDNSIWVNEHISMKFNEKTMNIIGSRKNNSEAFQISLKICTGEKGFPTDTVSVSVYNFIMFWKEIYSHESFIIHKNAVGGNNFSTTVFVRGCNFYYNPFTNSDYINHDFTKYDTGFLPSAINFPLVFIEKNNKNTIHFMNIFLIKNEYCKFVSWRNNEILFPVEYEPYTNIILNPEFLSKIEGVK